jgi:uncharacterized protein (DUF433 family)
VVSRLARYHPGTGEIAVSVTEGEMLITEYVSETPGVNGGYPVISGTRTPVWVLVEYARDSYDVQQIVELLPHLRSEQVQGALDYYASDPERVDEDRARNSRAWSELTGQPWPA